ncbi:MAG TPA: hypothetical protein VF483_04075 [Gemmatimonadaceae bacterium]
MSRHTVRLKDIVVGWSDLEIAEPNLGRASGRFRSGLGYELVQPVFLLYSTAVPTPGGKASDPEKLERYYRARDALGLTLHDDAGRTIATSAIHIIDYPGPQGTTLDIEVLISDPEYWRRRDKGVVVRVQ